MRRIENGGGRLRLAILLWILLSTSTAPGQSPSPAEARANTMLSEFVRENSPDRIDAACSRRPRAEIRCGLMNMLAYGLAQLQLNQNQRSVEEGNSAIEKAIKRTDILLGNVAAK